MLGKVKERERAFPAGERNIPALNHSRWATASTALRRMIRFVAVPREVIRTLRSPNIARGFPRYTAWLRRLVVAEVVLLTAIGIVKPWLLAPVLVLIALGSAWFWWQARPSRGRGRAWPPGSVGVGSQAMSDPDFYFKGWQTYGPVFKANLFDKPIVCVVGVKEAMELFHEHGDSLAPASDAPWNRFIPGGLARWMTEDTHGRYRKLFAGSLGSGLIGRNRGLIRREIDRSLSLMAAESAQSGGVAPLPYIQDLVFGIWAGLFFGISRTSHRFEGLEAAFQVISIEKQAPTRAVRPALLELRSIIGDGLARPGELPDRRRLSDTLLGEVISREADALSDPVTMINLIYLMETTSLDVVGLLMWLLKHGAENPQYLNELRSVGEDSGPLSLVDRMVSESVRLEQSEYLHRYAIGDIRFRGLVIPKGWMVHVCIHESHRDPQIFEDPDAYNPDRFLDSHHRADYAPFGIGGRACIGVPLTREISRCLYEKLAVGYELSIVEDGPRELSVQRHWAPSSSMKLKLQAR